MRNKRKLAAVTRKAQEENPRNSQSRNTSVPRVNEEYITQVSEQIEGRVTKKLSLEFSRTKSRILGALSKLDEFLLNQSMWTHSSTVPGTFRNTNVENQGTNEDNSQSDPHPEAGIFCSQITQNSGPEVAGDIVTGVQGEIRYGHNMVRGVIEEVPYDMVTGPTERHGMLTGATEETHIARDMVTGAQGEICIGRDMVTAVKEEITYCSSGISSGKQKKARSTSQPQFHNENTPATIEADQNLLALQQLATNSNSANLNNNSKRISKLPKSLTTTMPTFDVKSEKFELLEDLFQTVLRIHNQLTEGEKIN